MIVWPDFVVGTGFADKPKELLNIMSGAKVLLNWKKNYS